jgi:hypothetical protein
MSFGASLLAAATLWFSHMAVGTLAMTWGAIVIEIAIGLALLLSWRWRIFALVLEVALHVAIVATIGLWSFSLVMVGASVLAASPMKKYPQVAFAARSRRVLRRRPRIGPSHPDRSTDSPPAAEIEVLMNQN